MNKQEFEKLVKKEIPQYEYDVVEMVYTWHPSIANVGGKDTIAKLYLAMGFKFLVGMYPAAEALRDLDIARVKLVGKHEDASKWYECQFINHNKTFNKREADMTARHIAEVEEYRADRKAEFEQISRNRAAALDIYEQEIKAVEQKVLDAEHGKIGQ